MEEVEETQRKFFTFESNALLIGIGIAVFLENSHFGDSGVTSFKLISEYIITTISLCSFILLFFKKDRFDREVLILIAISIFLTIIGELPFIFYNHMDNFPSLLGHLLKVLSFYFIYRAIVETGFEKPYLTLFRELKQREEALTEKKLLKKDCEGGFNAD